MNQTLICWFISAVIFNIVLGIIFHFIYKWSGNNPIAGIFGAVNESTWEHLKLLFGPALIFSIFEYFVTGKDYPNYIAAKAVSFYIGILLIIILFYTYTGILGTNCLPADILIFIVSVIVSQYIGYRILSSEKTVSMKCNNLSMAVIIFLAVLFVVFTFTPPEIALFKDPITGKYGLKT